MVAPFQGQTGGSGGSAEKPVKAFSSANVAFVKVLRSRDDDERKRLGPDRARGLWTGRAEHRRKVARQFDSEDALLGDQGDRVDQARADEAATQGRPRARGWARRRSRSTGTTGTSSPARSIRAQTETCGCGGRRRAARG